MQSFTQSLVRDSDNKRRDFWSKADRSSLEKWQQSTAPYRETFERDLIGKIDQPLLPANPRTHQLFDEPTYTGYEVMLDVLPDVFATGILLVPKNLSDEEKKIIQQLESKHPINARADVKW